MLDICGSQWLLFPPIDVKSVLLHSGKWIVVLPFEWTWNIIQLWVSLCCAKSKLKNEPIKNSFLDLQCSSGLAFIEQIMIFLRPISRQWCLIPKEIMTFKLSLLYLKHPYLKNNLKINLRSFWECQQHKKLKTQRFGHGQN